MSRSTLDDAPALGGAALAEGISIPRIDRVVGWVLNLMAPGAGLAWLGRSLLGASIAILFSVAATYAAAAYLLYPGEGSRFWRGLALGVGIGTYFGAQFRFAQTLRSHADALDQLERRAALRAVHESLQAGDYDGAYAALVPIRERAEGDLLVAVRFAQVLDGRGDARAARRAWLRVRELDRHGLYRQATRRALTRVAGVGGRLRESD